MLVSDIFSKDFLFNSTPSQESSLYVPLIVFFGILLIVAACSKIFYSKSYKDLSDRYFLAFLTTGILGFVYLFASYEELPWLGSRFFLLLILFTLIVWSTVNTVWALRHIPKQKEKMKVEDRYQRYLPKKKAK